MERNLRRALDAAKTEAGIDGGEKPEPAQLEALGGSIWLTEHRQPVRP